MTPQPLTPAVVDSISRYPAWTTARHAVELDVDESAVTAVLDILKDQLAHRSVRQVAIEHGLSWKQTKRVRSWLGVERMATLPEHGTLARSRRCGCEQCSEARARYAAEEYARSGRTTTTGPLGSERAGELDERRRASLRTTAELATKRGKWTEDERAIALDMSRSAEAAALLLGRSRSAVEHQRARHARDRTASGPLPRGKRAARDRA